MEIFTLPNNIIMKNAVNFHVTTEKSLNTTKL